MSVGNIDNQNFSQQLETGETYQNSSPSNASASSICSLETSSGCCCIDRTYHFISELLSAIWSRLFGRDPEPAENLHPAFLDMGRRLITMQISEENFRELSSLECKAAIIIKYNDQLIACHYDRLVRDSLENFKNAAFQKMEQALSSHNLNQDSKLHMTTIFLENHENNLFTQRTWQNWSRVRGRINMASSEVPCVNQDFVRRFIALDNAGPEIYALIQFMLA